MLAIERRQEIMRVIQRDKSVRVHVLADKFDVTEETIRRDLDKLDKEGRVKKTYGGAVLEETVAEDPSFMDRQKVNLDKKQLIAVYASQLIEEGETIFIDMSTTALEVIKAVDPAKNITVITNYLEAIVVLGQRPNIRLVIIGGNFDSSNLFMGGPMSHNFIDHYYVDKTFFSVKGINMERGFMDSKEDIAQIKSLMVRNSREAILVADASKFDKGALVRVIDTDKVSKVITDLDLDEAWLGYFLEHDIDVTVVR